jgi:hypothetical protein
MRHRDRAKRTGAAGEETTAGEFDLHGDALDTARRARRDGGRQDEVRGYIETM